MRVESEGDLDAALGRLGPSLERNALLALILDAEIEPVTASRHLGHHATIFSDTASKGPNRTIASLSIRKA